MKKLLISTVCARSRVLAVPLLLAACALRGTAQAPEQLYRGELLTFPGPWSYQFRSSGIILTTDEELGILATDPDRVLNLSTGRVPRNESLRQICERAQATGQRTLSPDISQSYWQKAVLHGITEFPHSS